MSAYDLNDAMPARPLGARWVIRGTFTLQTALHLGGEEGDWVDMAILRDPRSGSPLLPGTTLAGALRSALADRLAGYGAPEPPAVARLFGGARGDDRGVQSPLIVFDALGVLPRGGGVEIRDGVAISPRTGTAEAFKKYDFEVLPPGTRFDVRLDLLVPASNAPVKKAWRKEKELLELLAGAVDAFTEGEQGLGARRSRGLGRVKAVWAARRFDLTSAEGWCEWVCSDHEDPIGREPRLGKILHALQGAAPEDLVSLAALRPRADRRQRVVVELLLDVVEDLLVRSPGTTRDAPDVTHLHTAGKPVLPGTSLAGVMRAQAVRIARLVRQRQGDGDAWVDRLFGPRFEGQRPTDTTGALRASRLRVGEATLSNSVLRRQIRVAIDRFTQGVVETALFDEAPAVGGRATVRLELRNPKPGELGLVLLVVKDLLDSVLPVGGTSGVGRGYVRGTATVTWHDGKGGAARTAELRPGHAPSGEAADEIDAAIEAFHSAPCIVGGASSGEEVCA